MTWPEIELVAIRHVLQPTALTHSFIINQIFIPSNLIKVIHVVHCMLYKLLLSYS